MNYRVKNIGIAVTLAALAAILTSTGPLTAWTVLRSTNGALSLRAEQLAGAVPPTIALTYSRSEHASVALEKRCSTAELMELWLRINWWRAMVLIAGTVVGVWAIVGDL